MRRLWMLYLVLGLVATQGCHKTTPKLRGVCDCYPPPVESLLVAPCPSRGQEAVVPVTGPYASAPYAAMLQSEEVVNVSGNDSPVHTLRNAVPVNNAPKRTIR